MGTQAVLTADPLTTVVVPAGHGVISGVVWMPPAQKDPTGQSTHSVATWRELAEAEECVVVRGTAGRVGARRGGSHTNLLFLVTRRPRTGVGEYDPGVHKMMQFPFTSVVGLWQSTHWASSEDVVVLVRGCEAKRGTGENEA